MFINLLNASIIGISYKIFNYTIAKAKERTINYLYTETTNILFEKTKSIIYSYLQNYNVYSNIDQVK